MGWAIRLYVLVESQHVRWVATIKALRAKGYEITIVKDDDGRVNGVLIDPTTSFRLGGADPREMGYALGW